MDQIGISRLDQGRVTKSTPLIVCATGIVHTIPRRINSKVRFPPEFASGTNLRLKKVVVVEGVYISEQPPGGQVGQSVAGAAKLAGAMKQTAQSARATAGESTDVKIQGQAQVGNEEKIDINAIAVPMKAKN